MYFCVMVSVKAQVVCKNLLFRTDLTVKGNTSLYILSGYFPADLQLAGCLIPDSMVYFVTSVDSQST